jgi:hypothetical protein
MGEGSKVTRLPVEHRNYPRCAKCGRGAPTFDDVAVNVPAHDLGDWQIEGMTYHILCPCGAKWDLRKRTRS